MKINEKKYSGNKFYKAYLAGFFIILALPLLTIPPWFFPPDWGKTIVFRSILAILLFLFLAMSLRAKRGNLNRGDCFVGCDLLAMTKGHKIIWVLSGLLGIFLLSTVFSSDRLFSLWGSPYRSGGFITFAFYFLFAILTFFILKKRDWDKIWNLSFSTGILVSFIAIIQYYGLFNNIFLASPDRPPSTMGNPILLAIYLLLLIFMALSFAIKEVRPAKKTFYCFAALLFLFVILITGSRAAYLGFLLGISYFVLFLPAKKILKAVYNKILLLKVILIVLLACAAITVYYVNSRTDYPQFLEENRIFQAMRPRLSIEMFLQDPRFSAWQVAVQAIKEKPLLGWGPENFAIGFDKHYDPSLPYISKSWGGWWDRAHNVFLDISATSGIPAAIAYLVLLITIFYQLQKAKTKENENNLSEINENPIICHGIQATLIAYLSANFFSFDGFSSYLIFFLLIGYSLHLTNRSDTNEAVNIRINPRFKNSTIFVLVCILILFLWQYNLKPFQINAQTQKAVLLSDAKKCEQAIPLIDKTMKQHSFLDAYSKTQYIGIMKTCAELHPTKNLEYAKKGIEILKEAVKTRPTYPRFWIFLGSYITVRANFEDDLETKKSLTEEAYSYFEKAEELAPNHQEILNESAKTDMIIGDYEAMKEKAEKCLLLDSELADCYWIKALSEIYLKNYESAGENIKLAQRRGYKIDSITSLHQLIDAYAFIKNYEGLVIIYQELIKRSPDTAQYHSSLAFTYSQMGEYKKAKEEAMLFLELMPEAKEEVNEFLKTLPL